MVTHHVDWSRRPKYCPGQWDEGPQEHPSEPVRSIMRFISPHDRERFRRFSMQLSRQRQGENQSGLPETEVTVTTESIGLALTYILFRLPFFRLRADTFSRPPSHFFDRPQHGFNHRLLKMEILYMRKV